MVERLTQLFGALLQGVVYSVITPVTAAAIGALVALASRPQSILLGAEIGAVVGGLLVLAGLTTAFGAPMGFGGFVGWWVREIPVPLSAIAVAAWSYFPLSGAMAGRTVFGLQLTSLQGSIASGLVAFFAVFPLALTLIRLLVAQAPTAFLIDRTLRGGVQPVSETHRRVKAIGGHRPFGPPGGKS